VCFNNIPAIDFSGSDSTVVRALRAWVTALGPAVWPSIRTKQGVFLFKTKPCMFIGVGVHQSGGVMSVIEFVWASVVVPCLAQHEDVVATAEGVGIYGNGPNVDIGVVSGCLTSR